MNEEASEKVQQLESDEVSLFDIMSVIVRRKFLFVSVFIICFLIGAVYTIISSGEYQYTQFIRLAGYRDISSGKQVSFRSSKQILPLMNGVYIPQAVEEYNLKYGGKMDIQVNSIKAKGLESYNYNNKDLNPDQKIDNPNFVMLSVKIPEKLKQTYSKIFQSILAILNKDEKSLIAANKTLLLERLSEYQKRSRFLSVYYKKVLDFNRFATAHMPTSLYNNPTSMEFMAIKNSEGESSKSSKNSKEASSKSSGAENVNGKVLMRALTQQSISIVSQNQLFAADRMHNAMQEQAALANLISNTKFELNTTSPSSFFSGLQRSQRPIGLSWPAKIVLFLIFGAIVGFFAVFWREFFENYKKGKGRIS